MHVPVNKSAIKAVAEPCAEVIESTLNSCRAQCWQWDTMPDFGSLIIIRNNERTIFGVVHHIQTASIDSSRTPMAFGLTEAELHRDQPQIFTLLQTSFDCIILGYQDAGSALRYQWAPTPPKMHAFVSVATSSEYAHFFSSEQYINVLFGAAEHTRNLDELLLALLQQQAQHGTLTEERLKNFIQIFSLITGNDYRRLKLFLQRVTLNVAL